MKAWTWREVASALIVAAVVLAFLVIVWAAQPAGFGPMMPAPPGL